MGECIMNVKKSLILLIVLLLPSITSQAHSFNICDEAAKGLTETNVKFSEYFVSYVKDHNAEGRAKVRDVYPTDSSSEYRIVLDCGNDVLLSTKSGSGMLKDLKIGEEVSFSGNVQGWSKNFYRESIKYFIEITLGNSSISH